MNINSFLETLKNYDVELWTDSEQLYYRGSKNFLTSSMLDQIRKHKDLIIRHLQLNNAVCKTFPLSYAQKSLWYIYQSAPDSAAYNTAMAVRLLFEVDLKTLKSTLNSLIARHSSLRSFFSILDTEQKPHPLQNVFAYPEFLFEQIDASTWSLDKLKSTVRQAHQRPFELENGPVFRANLFTKNVKDHVLLLSIHHIVCDGWSMWILMDELWKIYCMKDSTQSISSDISSQNHRITYKDELPSLIQYISDRAESSILAISDSTGFKTSFSQAKAVSEFEEYIHYLLYHVFQRMGFFREISRTYHKDKLREKLCILPRYLRLYEAILDILINARLIEITDHDHISFCSNVSLSSEKVDESFGSNFEKKKQLINKYPDLKAYLNLVDTCLSALPEVLTGKKNYMEVLFPNGSMRQVESAYKGNKFADGCNHAIAAMVKSYIDKRVHLDSDTIVRILEVGAGTGGTSQFIFEAIKETGKQNNVKYYFTDISPAFTQYGSNAYADKYPFVEFDILNINKNSEEQGIEIDSIDIILASNVLHASRFIENTLIYLKRLLKTNGLLLINEITELQSFLTLTFGLTDGWWHYEDEENRIKGSPLIHRKKWLQLLSNSGYRKINFLNLEEIITDSSTVSGPTVIAAESDGVNISKSINLEKHNLRLKNISHHYENFVHWQSEMIGSERGDKLFQYWQKQLSGTLPVLNLPLDHQRPSQQTFSGDWIPFRLNPDLSEKLKKFARSQGVTLYSLLLSAYFILLHRYTGQNDLLVGCPTTGRSHESFNDIIGDFVNTIVIRANCSTNPTIAEFIVQVSQTLLNALNHQDYPFSLLVERLNPRRDPNISPIFQTMFVFQKPHNFTDFIDTVTDFYAEEGIMEMYGYQFESFPFPQQEGQFDLSIEMTGSEDLLKGVLKYNSDLFDKDSMKRMCKDFKAILQCILEHPLEHLSDIEYIDEKDKLKILVEWNDTAEDFDVKCVHELFENQAKLTPDAIALVFKDQQLSYRELNYRANQLANYLISKGVKQDDTIGICVKRSFEMIIGILGILKAGGAYVPIDELYPRERLSFMIDDSQISFLLISDNLFNIFESFHVDLIHVDKDRHLIAQKDGSDPHRDISFNNLAYILYTSGSTGTPKGVAMPHQPLCNLISWQNRNTSLSRNAKTLQFTTLTFDVSFQEIFSTLSSGGSLLLFDSSLRQDPFALLELMQTKSVERLFTPFAFLQALAEAAETNSEIVPLNLREIITAGEQLRITSSIMNFIKKFDHCTLYNQYGPTETHVVTCFSLQDNPDHWPYLPPIGKPIANTQIYILDQNLKPVPQGVFGELYIGGICLARGYCNRPELTSQKFIKNPFSLDEDRLYRTGDIVRYLPDGNIEFHGRADHQVKIRGYRIEPYEIEKRLIDHDLITDAVVMGIENNNGIKSLCAYFVTKSDIPIIDIKLYLSEKLPSYMLPSYFIQLEQIPLLPNKKIDRLSLPKPNQYLSLGVEYVAPRDDIEKRLEEICQKIVNAQRVGIETNIFDIGINSLTTITMHRKIENFYPGKIKIPDFIQHPTISSLAGLIKKRKSSERKTSEKENQYQIFLESITKVEQ